MRRRSSLNINLAFLGNALMVICIQIGASLEQVGQYVFELQQFRASWQNIKMGHAARVATFDEKSQFSK